MKMLPPETSFLKTNKNMKPLSFLASSIFCLVGLCSVATAATAHSLTGSTSLPPATLCNAGLPAEAPADTLCSERGVICVSVCNIHAQADFESPMETQALLGTPVRILRRARWYQVETPDGYVSWVHRGVVVPMTEEAFSQWRSAAKIQITAPYSQIYSEASRESLPVGDIVAGCMLKKLDEKGDFYHVAYPDGRQGYVHRSEAAPLDQWLAECRPTLPRLVHTALGFTGIPYLWAGTSGKGVDCSGLVQLSALLNGVVLPRNASQQARVGRRIACLRTPEGKLFTSISSADSARSVRASKRLARPISAHDPNVSPLDQRDLSIDLSQLVPGDLVLFGKPAEAGKKERVTHIGIYLGQSRFLHSQGYVHTSSFLPTDPQYDAFNRNRFLGAVHIADEKGQIIAPRLQDLLQK